MNSILFAHLKIALAMAIVGSSVVFGKLITSSFPVSLASELRFIIASVILILFFYYKENKMPSIPATYLLILFLQAFTGVFLFNIFMLYGLKFTTAMEAGIITSSLPAVVGVIAFLFLKEKITFKKGVGILLAVLGVLLMNVVGGETGEVTSLFGNFLVIGAVICEALFITLGKTAANKLTPLTVTTMISIIGVILFLPFAIYESFHFNFSSVGVWDWMNIIYFGVVVTVVAFLLMYQGLAKVSASSAGVLTSVLPVSSIVLSFVILQEEITLPHLLGILFIFGAICFISLNPSSK